MENGSAEIHEPMLLGRVVWRADDRMLHGRRTYSVVVTSQLSGLMADVAAAVENMRNRLRDVAEQTDKESLGLRWS